MPNFSCLPMAGDPRMDAGADVGARDLGQLLAAGGAPEGLCPAATLAVIDELLAKEALWHSGHFLHQTVFSCLYMLQPARQAAAHLRVRERATDEWCVNWRDTRQSPEVQAAQVLTCMNGLGVEHQWNFNN